LIAYVASSLKTIPAILLERKLEFGRLSQIDILENITFYLCALFFAWRGFGLLSYAYATFIRSLLGLSYLYVLSPWSIGIKLDFKTVKNLLSYGLPFQINSFISLAKDRLSNIITAGILGTYSFGLISWGQKGPRIPLSFMDSVIRVSFPAYSRLQSDRPLFAKALSRNLFFISLLIIPALSILSLVAGPMVDIVPKYQKWHAALIPFYFFCFYFFIAAVTTPLTNAFNAIGQVKTTFKFMLMWTVLTWIFLPGFSYLWGINGALLAYLIIGLSSLFVWVYSQRQFNINVFNIVKFPFFLSLVSLLVALIAGSLTSNPYWLLSIRVVVFSLVFLSLGYSRLKSELIWLKNSVFSSFKT
jgi:PST family polysaccharide transporter